MQALTVVAECVPQVGIEDKQRTVQIHEWESDWNPNCNILETDRPQHDRPATCVIAQQYSSAAVIPLHFQSREENLGAFGECYYLTFFNLFSSAYVWNCGTLNCVIRWAFLYFRYLRTGISGIYVSVFQVSTYRYFRYLRTGISQGSCLSLCVRARRFLFPSTLFGCSPAADFASWRRLVPARCMNSCAHSPAGADRTRGHSHRPLHRGYQSDSVFWAEHGLIVLCSGEWACPTDTDWFVANRTSGAKRLVCLLCGAHTRLRKRVTRG